MRSQVIYQAAQVVSHMKLQATLESQVILECITHIGMHNTYWNAIHILECTTHIGMRNTQVEQTCVVHDSSAHWLIAAGQLHDGQSSVQRGFILWSWFHSVQAEEVWYMSYV